MSTVEEAFEQAAKQYLEEIGSCLGPGMTPPPEFEAVKNALDNGEKMTVLAARMYDLMCEQGMIYDKVDGVLVPTEVNYKTDYDKPEVKTKVGYIYQYGINLIKRGIIEVDDVKSSVKERLIARVGLTPEEFDEWLGY